VLWQAAGRAVLPRTTFDPSLRSIVDARALSGLAKAILDAGAEAISELTFTSRSRLKLLHCMYTVVRIMPNLNKTQSLLPVSRSSLPRSRQSLAAQTIKPQ
jgi:galactitol-specific phosphotransferase system IIC component